MPTRYLICGGRDFADADLLDKALSALILHPRDAIIIHGDAKGADRMAAAWGAVRGARIESYPALWREQGRAAGPIRNRVMLESGRPDVVIAFPGGAGTADMLRQARAAGVVTIPVIDGDDDGWFRIVWPTQRNL